ncbi:MAG: carboxymuconolactone decarboxylase family protein [Aliifodinibius sp.]|nr:carboxymuconolactone decarboxylase family protein [Fodinibius sp.]NIY24747.1 carboxymuconolactone decarboxylase family protein [Fodinibius sp.]
MINRLTKSVGAIIMGIFVLSSTLLGQESQAEATKKAKSEMKETLGTVPIMIEEYPDHLQAGAWEWFKATLSPEAAIPSKYAQLISLGVAAQIPCDYCVYAHTTMAKMLGATEEEIKGAIANAANTRHWSTVLNGADPDLKEFKKEWDGIVEHMKNRMEAKEASD